MQTVSCVRVRSCSEGILSMNVRVMKEAHGMKVLRAGFDRIESVHYTIKEMVCGPKKKTQRHRNRTNTISVHATMSHRRQKRSKRNKWSDQVPGMRKDSTARDEGAEQASGSEVLVRSGRQP